MQKRVCASRVSGAAETSFIQNNVADLRVASQMFGNDFDDLLLDANM